MLSLLIVLIASIGLPQSVPQMAPIVGKASYYTSKECQGKTASGEKLNDSAYTCATKFGHYGDIYLIRNKENGRFVIARKNDHGPHRKGRIVDLTKCSMVVLDAIDKGIVNVEVYRIWQHK